MNHHITLTIALLLLSGCGEPQTPQVDATPAPEAVNITSAPAELEWTSYPNEFSGKVVKVIDGDTIDVLPDTKETIRIRLNGIACPERGQPFANNATDYVSETIGGAMVLIHDHGQDQYGRTIGDVFANAEFYPDSGTFRTGMLINGELVAQGLAWHYVEYAPDAAHLAEAEQSARKAKRGLWSGSHEPIAPWDWHRMSKEERDEFQSVTGYA